MAVVFRNNLDVSSSLTFVDSSNRFVGKYPGQIKAAIMPDARRVYERGGMYSERSGNTKNPCFIQMSSEDLIERARAGLREAQSERAAIEARARQVTGRGRSPLADHPHTCVLCQSEAEINSAKRLVTNAKSDRDRLSTIVDKCNRDLQRAARMEIPPEEDEVRRVCTRDRYAAF